MSVITGNMAVSGPNSCDETVAGRGSKSRQLVEVTAPLARYRERDKASGRCR